MASASVKSGNLPLIGFDDDDDDGGTATGDKPGAKHVDTEKGVKNYRPKGEEFAFVMSNGSMHRHFDNFKI